VTPPPLPSWWTGAAEPALFEPWVQLGVDAILVPSLITARRVLPMLDDAHEVIARYGSGVKANVAAANAGAGAADLRPPAPSVDIEVRPLTG